ncbi:MAG: hypothetical protein AAGI53_10545 [Planctomycetota bacterium]
MDPFIDQNTVQWIVLAVAIIVAVASGTHIVTSLVRNVTYVHDTHRAVVELQNRYTRDLMRLRGVPMPGEDDEVFDVDVIDDDSDEGAETDESLQLDTAASEPAQPHDASDAPDTAKAA